MAVPKYDDLFDPLFQAIKKLGGSASIAEQEDAVATMLSLSEKEVSEVHRGNRTKLSYRLAWARNYLKNFGVLENSARGVWSLSAQGQKLSKIAKEDVKKAVQRAERIPNETDDGLELTAEASVAGWEEQLLEILKGIPAAAFERLCQRLLRESGFIQVVVTGRSGDGGIDGKGVVRVGGLLSFHVIFQCKRYRGSVGASAIRDFRGAMIGRADKGLFITTGSFTRDARAEGQRDGAPPIDLIDGEELVTKLKELGIGVEVKLKTVEEIVIQKPFFDAV